MSKNEEKKLEERQHALLSPSAAHRWLLCTPSAVAESKLPETAGEAAAEGTVAHAVVEAMLQACQEVDCCYESIDSYDLSDAKAICRDDEMWQSALMHCQRVLDVVHGAGEDVYGMLVEERVSMEEFAPECRGTADTLVVTKHALWVIDYKYGQGVRVDAADNAQLKLYGLGALAAVKDLFGYVPGEVRLVISQPRLNHYDEWSIESSELLAWGSDDLRPRAELAARGEGERVAGDHCRWCRAKGVCRERTEASFAIAARALCPPADLTVDEIEQILQGADLLRECLKSIEEYALGATERGELPADRFRITEGRSLRKYRDDKEALDKLIAHGYKPDDVTERKILSIGKLEKSIGKKAAAEVLGDLVYKPAGAPKLELVRMTNAREGIEELLRTL